MFTMNVADHPKFANVYDSLGKAYMISGDKKLADDPDLEAAAPPDERKVSPHFRKIAPPYIAVLKFSQA